MYKTEGIIIKTANLGEFDRLIVVYTRDFGKLNLRGKAVRKNQAKLCGHLNLFLYSHLLIAPARGYDIIAGAETIESFSNLRSKLQLLAAAYYAGELVDRLVVAPQKDENIWRSLLSFFKALDQERDLIKNQVQNLERELVYYLGYGEGQKNIRSIIKQLIGTELNSFSFYRKLLF